MAECQQLPTNQSTEPPVYYVVRFKLGKWVNVMHSPVPRPDWPWAGEQL